MKIFCVIVSYYPDTENLIQLCQALIHHNSTVIIVDNTEESYINKHKGFHQCILITLGKNTGIAHGQNIGIKHAIKSGADIIVFFDQDSKIERDFLPSLLTPLKVGEPGVVVPVFFDDSKGFEFPQFMLNKFGFPMKVYRGDKRIPYDVDLVTSSGTAATAMTFNIAGLMDEDFFIDFVDTEWSLRCRNKKIRIQVVPAAVMRHSVGEKSINMGFMRVFIHGPTRGYYKIRNSILLFKKENVPFLLALKEFISTTIHYLISAIVMKDRIVYIRDLFFAIVDSIRGAVGKRSV